MAEKDKTNQEPGAKPQVKTAKKKTVQDTIYLIDRYSASPTQGQQVLDFAALWKKTQGPKGNELTGALAHQDLVTVVSTKEVEGNLWAKVKANAVDKATGQNYPQAGYLKATLLKDLGATVKHFET